MGFLDRIKRWLVNKSDELQIRQCELDKHIEENRIKMAALKELRAEQKELEEYYAKKFDQIIKEGRYEELEALNKAVETKNNEIRRRLEELK